MEHLDFIMKYEAGQATSDEIVAGFQAMLDDGIVWHLQGSYGRMALDLIRAGHCTHPCPTCQEIIAECNGFGPSHSGSRNCKSGSIASGGKYAHCTCDTCF